MSARRVSSPASTGGVGTVFEPHVGAYWLAQVLVRAIPPILHDCIITQVHFQTEHLGWRTDDFLVEGRNGAGVIRKLAGQVKRNFTLSATGEECKKAFLDFWADFKNPAVFSPDTDRFALVTLRGTNTLLENFGGLLDCARAARDGAEFEHRLNTPGFLATKTVHYCDGIRAIVGEGEGRPVTAAAPDPAQSVSSRQGAPHLLGVRPPLPESEREFRGLFWQDIVRADAKPAGGMPLKRKTVFEEIAVRRARALSAYVPARDLDAAVIDSLRGDSLIASPEQTAALVAPAHDVLEDWAILQWIEQQHAANDGAFDELSAVIGTHPAVHADGGFGFHPEVRPAHHERGSRGNSSSRFSRR